MKNILEVARSTYTTVQDVISFALRKRYGYLKIDKFYGFSNDCGTYENMICNECYVAYTRYINKSGN